MNTSTSQFNRHRLQNGSATLVVLALLTIMLTLITANIAVTRSLSRELRLLDRAQQHHWEQPVKK